MTRHITSRWLDYPEDCIRLCQVALDHHYYIDPLEAQVLWTKVSDDKSAGWLVTRIYSDEEIWSYIKSYIDE